MKKSFLLQQDEVSLVEKRVVRQAAMLTDASMHLCTLSKLLEEGLPETVPVNSVPVGSVEFVSHVMRLRDIAIPFHMSYPDVLYSFLKRKVWCGVWSDAKSGLFVKPFHEVKHFTGALFEALEEVPPLSEDYPVWLSEGVRFVSEWRYYVLNDVVVGCGRYDEEADDALVPDFDTVLQAVQQFAMVQDRPSGYAIDFGVMDNGETALVEVNDGYAIGYYKSDAQLHGFQICTPKDYAELLAARWKQIEGGL